MASVVAHEGGLLFLSTLWTFWVSHQDCFFFFFLLNSQSLGSIAESGTLMFFINVLSYHDVNGIGLVFLPIFFPLVHGQWRMYLPCVSCPEMMSEDILSLVYIYLSENV